MLDNSSSDQPTSAMGIKYRTNSSEAVTILLAKSSNRYRIQSNSLTSLNLATEQLIFRLHKHYSNGNDFKIFLGSSLPTNEVLPYISKHFNKRQELAVLDVGNAVLYFKNYYDLSFSLRKNFRNTVGS